MKITFLGAAHEVTGSCTLLNVCGKNILIDCGMEQGADIYENGDIPVSPSSIDFVFLTHAHIDHSGKIPMLCAGGFNGEIYTTLATQKLCGIMLADSAHIQEFEAGWRNRKAKRSGQEPYVPLYTAKDVEKALTLIRPCSYDTLYDICDGITASFADAGHLLGSASITLTCTENNVTKSILFSGDLGNHTRPIIRDTKVPTGADYVVIESTYGDRIHGERPDYAAQLSKIIQRTFDRGGNVVIPSFAVGRTQELLYILRRIKSEGRVNGHDGFPVYVDSPLAVEATNIYAGNLVGYYDDETARLIESGVNPLVFDGLHLSVTSDDSVKINIDKTPKVILSASGMCEAGRIRHHLKHNLWRRESTILFAGYQSEGTIGRMLVDGKKEVKLFGEEIRVNAEIAQLDGISGHADKAMLLDWLSKLEAKPCKIFVNHGDDGVCDAFANEISEKLNVEASAPYNGAEYYLTENRMLCEGNRDKIKNPLKTSVTDNAYRRLVSAAQRLVGIIENCKNLSSKELSRFENQIVSLCEKWSKK